MKLTALVALLVCLHRPSVADSQGASEVFTIVVPDIDFRSPEGDILDLDAAKLSSFDSKNLTDDRQIAALFEKGDLAYDRVRMDELIIVGKGEYALVSEEELLASGLAQTPERRRKGYELHLASLSTRDYVVLSTRGGGSAVLFFQLNAPGSISVSWVLGKGLSIEKARIVQLIELRKKMFNEDGGIDSFGLSSIRNSGGKSPTMFDFKSRTVVPFEPILEPGKSPQSTLKPGYKRTPFDLSYHFGLGPALTLASAKSAYLGLGSIQRHLGKDLKATPLQRQGFFQEPDFTVGSVYLIETYRGKLALIRIEAITRDEVLIRWLLDGDGSGMFEVNEKYWRDEAKASPIVKKAEVVDIYSAIHTGSMDRLKAALESGISVNAKDRAGWTPLHYAAGSGQLEVCKFLVESGADPEATSDDGTTTLQVALRAMNKNPPVIEYLKTLRGFSSLIEAAEAGSLSAVHDFIARGVNVNEIDLHQKSALHYAAKNGYPNIIAALLKSGADPHQKCVDGNFTPLCLAAASEMAESVEALLESAQIEAVDKAMALEAATSRGYAKICKLLLKAGADSTLKIHDALVPRDSAFLYARIEVVKVYMEAGIEIPIWSAARLGLVDDLKQALARGQSPNALSPYGASALCLASRAGQIEAARILLDAGATFAATESTGVTPLHEAVEARNQKLAELLIARGATVNATNKEGRTPLYLSVLYEQRDIAAILLKAGADPNLVPKYEGANHIIHEDSLLKIAGRNEAIRKLLKDAGAREPTGGNKR